VLQLVNPGRKSLADYASIATRGLMDEIRGLAEPLRGARVLDLGGFDLVVVHDPQPLGVRPADG